MFIVLAQTENELVVQDDTDNTVEPISKSDTKLLLKLGVSFNGASLNADELIINPTMQNFAYQSIEDSNDDYPDFDDSEDDEYNYDEDSDDYDEDSDDYDEDSDDYGEDSDDYDEDDAYFGEDEDYDEEEEEEESTVSKLYGYLTPEQIIVLKRYYLWFSQRLFTDAQKDPTLGMKSQAALQRKQDSLKLLRSTGGLWHYAGFIDTGARGNGYCTLGHPLRYMHLAWDVTASDIETAFFGEDYNEDFEQAIESNNCIVFGIKCIGDFFEVDKDCINALQRAQRDSLKDMATMYEYYADNRVDEINDTFKYMDEVINKIALHDARGALVGGKKFESIIKPNLTAFYLQFRKVNLIPPKSLIQEIRDSIVGWSNHKFIYDYKNKSVSEILHMPSRDRLKKVVPILVGKSSSKNIVNILDEYYCERIGSSPSPHSFIYAYLSVYLMYKICGCYAYDGVNNTDEGGKNKQLLTAYKTLVLASQLFEGVDFDLEFIKKFDIFVGNYLAYNDGNILFKVPDIKFNDSTNHYEVDSERKVKSSYCIESFDEDNNTGYALSSAIDYYSKMIYFNSRNRAGRLSNYKRNFDSDFAEAEKNHNYIEENIAKFEEYAKGYVQKKVDKKNAELDRIKEEEEKRKQEENEKLKQKKQEEERAKEKADKKLEVLPQTDTEIIDYLASKDLSSYTKFDFARNLVKQLSNSNREPSSKQMYYIGKLYTEVSGVKYVPKTRTTSIKLSSRPDLQKALKYIVDNNITCESDLTFAVIKTITSRGTISEKQMKYAESGLKTYKSIINT